MQESIPFYFKALFIATVFALLAELLLNLVPVLKKYHIPRAFIGGLFALITGPQIFGELFDLNLISQEIQNSWNEMALFFVNVVFACIFLGRTIPKFKTSMALAIPQASLGQMLAWGQYLVGGVITLLVLKPLLGLDESVASFIEISFQGGVGVAVGMEETFKSIGLFDAKSITVALAPLAMLTGILSGVFLINLKKKRTAPKQKVQEQSVEISEKMGVNRVQDSLIVQIAIIGIAILLGLLLLRFFEYLEQAVLLGFLYDHEFVKYIPLFPLALLGGAILQLLLDRFISVNVVNRKSVKRIQSFSLDAVIIMAIGTINLGVIKSNVILVLILLGTGFLWNITAFLLTYKVLIPKYSFERGIADYGQSMGTTSIGLMLQSIADKDNISRGKEAFGIKQLIFEPFVGGGLITALSPIFIMKMGLIYFTSLAFALTLAFFLVGFFYNRKNKSKQVEYEEKY